MQKRTSGCSTKVIIHIILECRTIELWRGADRRSVGKQGHWLLMRGTGTMGQLISFMARLVTSVLTMVASAEVISTTQIAMRFVRIKSLVKASHAATRALLDAGSKTSSSPEHRQLRRGETGVEDVCPSCAYSAQINYSLLALASLEWACKCVVRNGIPMRIDGLSSGRKGSLQRPR